ncbi:MAG TPA: lytic transglycosylase domain-containing protein [Streptosporangiaceae bacterium]
MAASVGVAALIAAAAPLQVTRHHPGAAAGPLSAAAAARQAALARSAGLAQPPLAAQPMAFLQAAGLAQQANPVLPARPAADGRPPPAAVHGAAPAVPSASSSFRRIVLPDLLIVAPRGLTARQVSRLRAISGVRNMITFDGAEIRAGGRQASVIGVRPAQFRSWVPLRAASDQPLWTALSRGGFIASRPAAARLGLRRGTHYQLTAGRMQDVRFGGSAGLGLTGVDLLVDSRTSHALGLVHRVAGLISAPGAQPASLTSSVRRVLGAAGRIVSLRKAQLPVAPVQPGQLPTTYLQLFKVSAATYCPGLSWTVLAAIGQIESGDGANVGPSTAGALGPMQFLPSTWAIWGIRGFGRPGPPDIMDPYDAVPSAARLLCADGAAAGGQSLRAAIFDYNHATWYVNDVLALAAQYAADFP